MGAAGQGYRRNSISSEALDQQRPVLAASLAAVDVRSERSSPAVRLQPQARVVAPPVPDPLAENQKYEAEAGAGELSVSTE